MRRGRAAPVALAAVAAVIAAAGCGGSDGRRGAQEVGERQLALMPLRKVDVPEARTFTISADASGLLDRSRAAETTIDPNDTSGDVAAEGWVRGYDVSYVERGLASLTRGSGVLEVDTSVALFSSAAAAARFNDRQTRDFGRMAHHEVDAGVVLVSSSGFGVPSLGDAADGLHAEFRIGGRAAYSTFVDFRVGRLLCEAAITRADRQPAERRVEQIARALERRVRGVLAGTVHGPPQALPKPPLAPTPPAGVPNLSSRVLQLRDLPDGSRIRREAYVKSASTTGSFSRDFHVGPEPIGRSRLLALQSAVDLFRTGKQALQALTAVASAYSSASGPMLLARLFSREAAGGDLKGGKLVSAGKIPAGDDGFAVEASFEAPLTRVTGLLIVVRVGDALGSIVATGQTGHVSSHDLVPLAQQLATRLRTRKLKI
jgi:hypothetical protein